jgi:penicillin-binding protein 1B
MFLRRIFILTGCLMLVASIVGGTALYFQWRGLKQYLNQFSWDQSIRVYSRPLSLMPDSYVLSTPDFLRSELLAYGYREVPELTPLDLQTFSFKADQVCVVPASPPFENKVWEFYITPFCVKWGPENLTLWKQTASGASSIQGAHLPPILIGFLFAKDDQYEVRTVARLDEVPSELIWAVISIEDERFFEHQGVDLKSIARAFVANILAGGIVQGGSTITQQLIKNMLLTQEKTLWRKLREAILAYLIETAVSKDEILIAYLNEIYFGSRGHTSIYGIKEASYYYWGKPPTALTLAESASLAAMIKNPGFYVRFKNNKVFKDRRNIVLDRLEAHGYATKTEIRRAKLSPVVLKKQDFFKRKTYGYILDAIRLKTNVIQTNHSNILMTSIDPLIQSKVVQSVQSVLDWLRSQKSLTVEKDQKVQGALLVVAPKTGDVLGMHGGYDYVETQFNRALDAKRQIGSTIKPFIYAAALQHRPDITPLTPIFDHPFELQTRPDELWKPKNYKETYFEWVTLRQALENSINVATIKLSLHVGLHNIGKYIYALWPSLPGFYPSSAVGSMTLSLDLLLSRYQVFYHCSEKAIFGFHWVYGQDREVITNPYTCDVLAQVGHMMSGVVSRGTASSLSGFIKNKSRAFKGKTGTTNDGHDSWFIGSEKNILAGAWVGFDQLQESKLTGAGGALPIFGTFMKHLIAKGYDPKPLEIPNKLNHYHIANYVYDRNDITHLLKTPEYEWIQGRLTSKVFKTKIE